VKSLGFFQYRNIFTNEDSLISSFTIFILSFFFF
jgi:hypothetical protein